jgi:phosphomannomutase
MGFFKAYDMRGTFGKDFDLATVRHVGEALPKVVGGRRWLVGRDCRVTSSDVRDALVAGLQASGAEVTDLGPATTPMVYFATAQGDFDGSVQVTASHNPPSDNGLKVSKRGALPVGYSSGLAEVERLVAAKVVKDVKVDKVVKDVKVDKVVKVVKDSKDLKDPKDLKDVKDLQGFKEKYIAWLKAHAGGEFAGLRFAVDCSDGMAGILAHDLFGPDALYLNDVPDGNFPHHSPNPLLAEAREQLSAAVRENGLDCGVIFDGDADRCMFVDENGDFIQPDYLIPALAATYPERGVAIHDVRTSRAAIEALRAEGFTPVMGKVGHAFAKVLLRETGAICGGELAGHYYFRDFFHCDSGELAALRLLVAFARAKAAGMKVSEFLAPVARKYANSGEMNFKVDDKEAAIARVLEAAKGLGEETGRSDIDGYRLEYAEGWVSVRQSNTEPLLRLLVECDTPERLEQWRSRLVAAV